MSGTVTPSWSRRSRMCGTASAASAVFTVTRTSSDPALASDFTCCAVPSTSAVSVFVIDWTTIGAVPPTRTWPMDTGTDLRRWMGDILPAGGVFPGIGDFTCYDRLTPLRSVRRESGHQPERRRRKLRPETLRQTNGRSWGLWRVVDASAATHRRGAAPSAPDLSGHRTEGRRGHPAPAASTRLRSACDPTNRAVRPAPQARRQDGGLRRLGHAAAIRLADRGASCRAPQRRCFRRLTYVRRRSEGRACQAFPPETPRQRRGQAEVSRQGTLRLHAQRERRRHRRLDRLFLERVLVPRGRQCGYAR